MKKSYLQQILTDLLSNIYDFSEDFVNNYSISCNGSQYLSDLFSEASDSALSIYYTDQYNYWSENSEDCENSLLALYDSETLADIIKREGLYRLCCLAGSCGAYDKNISQLYEDEEQIIKSLYIKYLLENKSRYARLKLKTLNNRLANLEASNVSRLEDIIEEAK